MLSMSQINNIRDLKQSGYNVAQIEKMTGICHKTINKYLEEEDFSPKAPLKTSHLSILDPYKVSIDQWLTEDKKYWHKQRHSAKRVFKRLETEKNYTGSYNLVQRYVKAVRDDQRRQRADQELI